MLVQKTAPNLNQEIMKMKWTPQIYLLEPNLISAASSMTATGTASISDSAPAAPAAFLLRKKKPKFGVRYVRAGRPLGPTDWKLM